MQCSTECSTDMLMLAVLTPISPATLNNALGNGLLDKQAIGLLG